MKLKKGGEMRVQELCEHLVFCTNPSQVFGKIADIKTIKKNYLALLRKIHPDVVEKEEVESATKATSHINRLINVAYEQVKNNNYGSEVDLSTIKTHSYDSKSSNKKETDYNSASPLFEMEIRGNKIKIYEQVFAGNICDVFAGLANGTKVFLKVGTAKESDVFLENEFQILARLNHYGLPKVIDKFRINGNVSILVSECKGECLSDILDRTTKPIPQSHVMWILERLLNVTGYLHSNIIVHSNIKPETVILDKDTHNISLVGLYFGCDVKVDPDDRYKVKNKKYSAPEVSKTEKVHPCSDIYSIGQLSISMLAGSEKATSCPAFVDKRLSNLVNKMVDPNPKTRANDAFKLWDELREVRTQIVGTKRFEEFTL